MNPIIEYENLRESNKIFFDQYKKEFEQFLDSGWFVLGDGVSAFESEYAKFCQVNYCVGVASGLDALILAIDAFDFPTGSEIIVPANTYIATVMAIIRNGFKPVLVEPDILTYNIDPTKIEERISERTVAIVVVHLYGKACNMGLIMDLACRYNLQIVEDVAQAQGAKYKNKVVGSFGVGCHSFYPTKNLGALGDAGAVTAENIEYINRIKKLRNYGSSSKYFNDLLGYNSRLDELQARFLSTKLKFLQEINDHKRRLAKIYFELLSDELVKPNVDDDFYDVFHIFSIRHPERDRIRDYLLAKGIKTEIHYPVPPHWQNAMQGFLTGDYPISEKIHLTTMSLPISFYHTDQDIIRVAETLNEWFK